MASTFPGAIDSFTDPLSNSPLNSPSHSTLHSDINDAVEKVEQYMGLVKVIPTSVTGGTLNTTTGTITIGNAQTTVIVNGAFTSLYQDYAIRISGVSTTNDNADLSLRLRAAGTNSTTNYNYIYQYVTYSGSVSTFAAGNNVTTFDFVGRSTVNTLTANIELSQPQLALNTNIRCQTPGGNIAGPMNGFHGVAASYDGFQITLGAGTMTGGTIRVYGYRN